MSTPVSFLQPCTTPKRRTQSLQLASAIHARRLHLKMSIEQAAEFSGLKPEQWADLENGWLPPIDPGSMWIWWTLASSLQMKADRLRRLASVDLARQEIYAKKKAAA